MKYIIYVRKSTEDREDRQVLSIDSQIEEIERKFPDLNVIEVIKESKSAYKTYNRPEFQRMIELFQEGKADGLLAWHPDRLSREPISGGMIMHLLDRRAIKDLKFASYNFDNSPEGKMMLGLSLSQSKYFSEKLSIDVKRGMVKKCKMGHRPTLPPLGYIPDRMAEKGEKRAMKDPERFDLVRKMWDLILTGQYSIMDIVRLTNQWGLTRRPTKNKSAAPLSRTTVYSLFSNLFYTGSFEWDGEIYKGDHAPMITMEEFDKVQIIIGNRHVPRPQKYESLTSGLVKCSCGASIVVDTIKKRTKTTGKVTVYKYARCSRRKKGTNCLQPQVNLEEVQSQMNNYLGKIRISNAFHKWAIKNINQLNKSEQKTRDKEIAAMRKAHDDCKRKLDNLLSLRIAPSNTDGSLLDDEEFVERRSKILKEREKWTELLNQVNLNSDKWVDAIREAFDVACNAQNAFRDGDIKTKKQIMAKIGANFLLQDEKLTVEPKRPYIVFEERLPEIRKVEEMGELEKSRFGKMKTTTQNQLFQLWSG